MTLKLIMIAGLFALFVVTMSFYLYQATQGNFGLSALNLFSSSITFGSIVLNILNLYKSEFA